jgi:hypothetical protein
MSHDRVGTGVHQPVIRSVRLRTVGLKNLFTYSAQIIPTSPAITRT